MATPGAYAPARLGRHELLARLATGGMGEIFLARLEGAAGFEKLNVVKRILPHLADDARFRAMLIAEARIASRMSHPNICQVYELGETDGQLYIVMEYLEGIALLPLLRKASKDALPLDFGLVAGVVQQCCDALHYAHELRDHNNELLGIIHRDVTPGNIFLTDSGIAKLLDFGIAKVKDASANTQTGTVKGKYAYMAPEQLRGGAIDRRVDVFALGTVIYEMLALRRLFQRKTDYLTFRAVMEQPIPDVRRYRPDVPDELAEVVMRALDRDPVRRPDTARQLGAAILGALGASHRPWSQGEIGDFVRGQFAAEISRRRTEAARAIRHIAGQSDRFTMPLIAVEDAASGSDDDDDGFPAIESTIADDAPPEIVRDFSGQTPPPFGVDSEPGRASGPQPLQSAPPQVVVLHKRSVVWPLIAIAMVGITATALFLVWRQLERQPPQEIIITQEPNPAPPVAVPAPARVPAPDEPPPADVGKPPKPVKPPRSPAPSNPYDAFLQANLPKMTECAVAASFPAARVDVHVIISPAGKATSVSFTPATLDGTDVARCISRVLSTARFPKTKDPTNMDFKLTARMKSG